MMVYVWLLIALFFLLAEIGHPGLFFFLSFFYGSLAAALAAYADFSLTSQFGIFFVAWILGFYLCKRMSKRFMHTHYRSNIYALEGKKTIVVETINEHKAGYVDLDGELWMARSFDGKIIEQNTMVVVVAVKGAHVVVRPLINS